MKEGSAKEALPGVWMNPATGCAHFAVSDTGDLIYVPGGRVTQRDDFVLVDRSGTPQLINLPDVANENRLMTSPSVSPDGSRIAVHMATANDDIYIYEFSNGSLTRASIEDGDQRSPIWSHDGAQLAYASESGPISQILLRNVSGSRMPEPLFKGESYRYPRSFRPDGKTLAFIEQNPKTRGDIWTGTLRGTAEPFLITMHSEYYPAFSSDGKWLERVNYVETRFHSMIDRGGGRLNRRPPSKSSKPVSIPQSLGRGPGPRAGLRAMSRNWNC